MGAGRRCSGKCALARGVGLAGWLAEAARRRVDLRICWFGWGFSAAAWRVPPLFPTADSHSLTAPASPSLAPPAPWPADARPAEPQSVNFARLGQAHLSCSFATYGLIADQRWAVATCAQKLSHHRRHSPWCGSGSQRRIGSQDALSGPVKVASRSRYASCRALGRWHLQFRSARSRPPLSRRVSAPDRLTASLASIDTSQTLPTSYRENRWHCMCATQ